MQEGALRRPFWLQKHSSSVIQQAWKQHDRVVISRELAAVILQRAWRSYHGRQTFLFYRDLISFKCAALPSLQN